MTAARDVPKAELHCHLEGAAGPGLVRRLARRNGMTLPEGLFDDRGGFLWSDFRHFLKAYDLASAVIRTPRDYRDVVYEYLGACAAEGAIYVEVMSSPDHAAANGMSYGAHLDGIAAGIEDAARDFAITGRLIVTCVRHFGPERAMEVARQVVTHPHDYVVGFGMGGDEAQFSPADFAPAFRLVHDNGLSCTVHAGEVCGAESVRAALDSLPVSRLGHGVRAVEDPALIEEIAARGIMLEVCPGSNIATGVYDDYDSHPLPQLLQAGCRVSLNSDDPPYFHTSIGREYARAAEHFALDETALRRITAMAIDAAFADERVKEALRKRL